MKKILPKITKETVDIFSRGLYKKNTNDSLKFHKLFNYLICLFVVSYMILLVIFKKYSKYIHFFFSLVKIIWNSFLVSLSYVISTEILLRVQLCRNQCPYIHNRNHKPPHNPIHLKSLCPNIIHIIILLKGLPSLVNNPRKSKANEKENNMKNNPFVTGNISIIFFFLTSIQSQYLIQRWFPCSNLVAAWAQNTKKREYD